MNYYELTNPQKAIWSIEQFYKGTNVNNICGTLTIKQDVDLSLLNKAVNLFVANNASFGINIIQKDDNVLQYFITQDEEDFEKVYLKDYREVQKLANARCENVFDLSSKKLYKFILFKLENDHGGFIILTHHIISDAGTFGLIGTEIAENYRKLLGNEEIEKKDYSYIDYINSEKEYMASSKFSKDEDYWTNLYKEIPELAMLPSVSIKNNSSFTGKAIRKEYIIDSSLLRKITELCKKNKISNFNFFMAIYAIYLSRVSNLKDFVIGTPILNRTNFKEKHTTGMFINTAPLRIKIEENSDFISCAKQIAQSSLSMLRYQKYPYELLLQNLRKLDNNLPALYDVMLSYQVTKAHDKNSTLPYEVEWLGTSTISNGIYIHLHDNNDEESLNIAYDYQIEKYEEKDIVFMHERILNIINQVLENENILESDIEILTEKEKNLILHDFNDTKLNYPKNMTIIDIFEEQASRIPHNTALVYDEKFLTYKELNEKANGLAKMLMSKGVKPKDVVGVLLPRSIEFVISIWAILKCGAIYMPLFTDYPNDRLNYMIKNSNAKLVLTNDSFKNKLDNNSFFTINNYENIRTSHMFNKPFITPNDIAYIIYTSGSTRKTKRCSNYK